MITTYYQYTDSSEGLPVERYNIHLNSVICANSNKKPVPYYKVITPRSIKLADNSFKVEERQVFSNFMLENGPISRYNSLKYQETTSSLSNINDSRWIPNRTYKSYEGVNDFYRHSYLTTLQIADKHDGDNTKFAFLKSESTNVGNAWFSPYAVINEDLPTMGEWPSPVVIRTDTGTLIKFYNEEDKSFSSPVYWLECSSKITFVYNLIPNKIYTYKVFKSGTLLKGIYGANNEYGVFKTEGQVRMLKFECIRNARDIGGWPTTDGGQLKYDLIFRGSQLDGRGIDGSTAYTNRPYNVPAAAINTLADKKQFHKLDILKEIDVRGTSNTTLDRNAFDNNGRPNDTTSEMIRVDSNGNPESTGIEYYRCRTAAPSYQAWSDNFNLFIGYVKAIIQGVEDGKKVYVHCMEGKDRTGSMLLLLEALCNVTSDSLIKEYEISSMWTSSTYNRFTLQMGNISGTKTVISVKNATLPTYEVTNADITIQEAIQGWFKKKYDALSLNLKLIDRSTNQYISSGEDAIKYILDLLVLNNNDILTEITVLGGYRTENKVTIYNSNGTSLEVSTTMGTGNLNKGATIIAEGNKITLSNILNVGETITGFEVNGNKTDNNFAVLTNKILVSPVTEGNLIVGYTPNYRWIPKNISSGDPRYCCVKSASTTQRKSFYALDPFFVALGEKVIIKMPESRANTTVYIELISTNLSGLSNVNNLPFGAEQATAINLNSKSEYVYTPTQSGFIFINVACKEVESYTVFTEGEIKEIRAKYNETYANNVPSFLIEKVMDAGSNGQSIVYYNGYIMHFRGEIASMGIIDVNEKKLLKTFTFTVASGIRNAVIHCQNATLLPIKYSDEDFFPMVVVSGDGASARVLRVKGNPTNVNSLSVEKVCDWTLPYSGILLATQDKLYFMLYFSTGGFYTINFNINNIANYSSNTTFTASSLSRINNYKVATQDATVILNSSEDIFVTLYGYLSGTSSYYAGSNTLSGLIFLRTVPSSNSLVGLLPFERYFGTAECDGIAWAGGNTLYLMFNKSGAHLYKMTLSLPKYILPEAL